MDGLRDHGWPESAVAFLDGLDITQMKETLGTLSEGWQLEDFEEVRQVAKRQRLMMDCEDRAFLRDPTMFQKDRGWKDRAGFADLSDGAHGVGLRQARDYLPRAVWPTRLSRRSALEADDQQRSKLEERERERLTVELLSILKRTGLLSLEDRAESDRARQWLFKRHAMGRRPNTLRQHVRLGRKLMNYMMDSYGRPWFRNAGDVMEYIALRLEEPCGKSIPSSVWSTIRFLEQSAEMPENKRVSADLALKNFFVEIDKHPSWAVVQPRVSARRLLLAVVIGWEMQVLASDEKAYIRVFAWFKLVKLWGALRWDDTMGIPPSSLEYFRNRGLRGKIVRSKTTGEGRRVDTQEFYVSTECWIGKHGWLEEGLSLFKELGSDYGSSGRDFLLPRPNRKLDGFRGAMVKYHEAMSMTRALSLNLTRWFAVGREDLGGKLIKFPEVSAFWSEHSERVTVVSWAAALQVDGEARKRWGRWKPSTDEEYVKTSLTMVMEAQAVTASKLRDQIGGVDLVEEDLVLAELGRWMEDRGFSEPEIDEQLHALRLRRGRSWKRKDGLGLLEIGDEEVLALEDARDQHSPTEKADGDSDKDLDLLLQTDSGGLQVSTGTFVLSVVGRSKKRTLHRVGSCYRVPGIHYKEFLVVGDNRPVLEANERLCASCFGKQDKAFAEAGASVVRTPSVSSVSSSTSLGSTTSEE